jgi:hypothetical protein
VISAVADAALAHGAALGEVVLGANGGDSGDTDFIIRPDFGTKHSARSSDHGSFASAEISVGVVSDC